MDTGNRRAAVRLASAVVAVVVVAGLGWFAFGHAVSAARALEQARSRWDERQPDSYAFTYFHCGGMCAYCPVRVTVQDGQVTAAHVSGEGCGQVGVDHAPTIEDVFEAAASSRPFLFAGSSTITYDSAWGFPSLVVQRCEEGASDCGSSWAVRDFEVLDEPA